MKTFFFKVVCVVTLICSTAFATYADDNAGSSKERIALLKLKPIGVDTVLIDTIEESLLTSIAGQNKYEIIERSQLDKILQEQGLSNTNDFSDDTATKIGNLLGVKIVFIGSVSKLNDEIIINLRGIDVATGLILFSARKSTTGSILDLVDTLAVSICQNGIDDTKQEPTTPPKKHTGLSLNLSPVNKAGAALTPIGSTLLLGGAVLLLVDVIAYFPVVRTSQVDGTTYADYETAYNTNIALFATSIALIGVGACTLAVGIPLLVTKRTTTSFFINMRNNIAFGFSIKLHTKEYLR